MTMYNQATQEIAKPSELLTSVRAYMTVLQSIENYVQIDITRVFNNVLLQQTQHLDSHGEPTITSLYTNWWARHAHIHCNYGCMAKTLQISALICSLILTIT